MKPTTEPERKHRRSGKLKNLRNALAHGVRSHGEQADESARTIADESRLRKVLKELRNKLF
jgi:hypothetical protein